METNTPLKGLILCGGYSTRMQQDKSNISLSWRTATAIPAYPAAKYSTGSIYLSAA